MEQQNATREQVLEKIGEAGSAADGVGPLAPQSPAGKMQEARAPAGSVKVVAGRASATAGAVSVEG